jgi:putative transposase
VQAQKAYHSVQQLCRTLGVSPSGFYAWQRRPVSARARTDRRLRVYLRAAHVASGGLHHDLEARGFRVGLNRVIRLMRHEQLRGRPRHRFRITTAADPAAAPAPNHLAQVFTTRTPNDVWAADITAIPTGEGWLYLAVLLDLFSPRIVGWAVDTRLETRLVLAAWQRAVTQRRTTPRASASFDARLPQPGAF